MVRALDVVAYPVASRSRTLGRDGPRSTKSCRESGADSPAEVNGNAARQAGFLGKSWVNPSDNVRNDGIRGFRKIP